MKVFALFTLLGMVACQSGENLCSSGDASCASSDSDDADEVSMLAIHKTKMISNAKAPEDTPSHPLSTPTTDVNGSSELQVMTSMQEVTDLKAKDVVKRYNELTETQRAALVPDHLAPVSTQELRKLNMSLDTEMALLDATTNATGEHSPAYPGVFCSSAKRADVAQIVATAFGHSVASLSLDNCYIFSCVPQFKASLTCGPYFYTNGQGNCKCCDYGSKYYSSSSAPKNDLYRC